MKQAIEAAQENPDEVQDTELTQRQRDLADAARLARVCAEREEREREQSVRVEGAGTSHTLLPPAARKIAPDTCPNAPATCPVGCTLTDFVLQDPTRRKKGVLRRLWALSLFRYIFCPSPQQRSSGAPDRARVPPASRAGAHSFNHSDFSFEFF